MLPLVAIVGRPNVGKSTLFNRMVGGRPAIVADEPGMTRDRHYGKVEHEGRTFHLVDTGGFEPDVERGIEAQIAAQMWLAIDEADLILLVWDAREGVTAADEQILATLRKTSRPMLFVTNKVDGVKQEALLGEFYGLGVDKLWPVSAEHGLGVYELMDEVAERLPPAEDTPPPDESEIRVALVGRPNAGKSALLNRLTGSERAIVSEVPGTTRDPIDARIETEQGAFVLVDTAGIRRKKSAGGDLERLAALWSVRRIGDAEVACLLIDAGEGPSVQDAKIANASFDAGRPLVIVIAKTDLLPGKGRALARKQIEADLRDRLGFCAFAERVWLSSLSGQGIKKLLPAVKRARRAWETRIATAELNRFLEGVTADHPPPSFRGRQVKLLFISQPQTCPPTFVIHVSKVQGVPLSYRRYIANRLRETFDFKGTPLRLFIRQRKQKEGRQPRRPPPVKGRSRRSRESRRR